MDTLFYRVAAGSVLTIAAAAALAGAPFNGSSFHDAGENGVELSPLQMFDAASAMEEIIVYGAAAVPHFEPEWLTADIREQARASYERLKASMQAELKRLAAPKLEVAISAVPPAVGLPPA
jgi:hypothetical protein